MNTTTPHSSVTKSIALLVLLGSIWGIGYSLARYVMTNGISPLNYSFWQAIGPTVFLFLFTIVRRSRIQLSWNYWKYYILTALLGIVIPNTNMYFIAPHLPAGILALIINTVPIIIYPLALLYREEQFNRKRLLGVCIGMLGILSIALSKASLSSLQLNSWVLLALISPVCFALCAVYAAKHRPPHSDSAVLSTGMLLVSTLLLLPLVITTDHFTWLFPPTSWPEWIVLFEIILTSIGYVLIFELLKTAGAVYYSLTGALSALTGLLWGRIIFGEHLTAWSFFATLCIVTAIVLITLAHATAKNKTPTTT